MNGSKQWLKQSVREDRLVNQPMVINIVEIHCYRWNCNPLSIDCKHCYPQLLVPGCLQLAPNSASGVVEIVAQAAKWSSRVSIRTGALLINCNQLRIGPDCSWLIDYW